MMAKEMVLASETMVAGFVRKAVTHNRLVSTFRLSSSGSGSMPGPISGSMTTPASGPVTASAFQFRDRLRFRDRQRIAL